jgi:hypothetical protein
MLRSLIGIALMMFFALFAVGGLIYLSIACYLALREIVDPWQAGLILGGGLLVLSLLGVFTTWFFLWRHPDKYAGESIGSRLEQPPSVDAVTRLGEAISAPLGQRDIRTIDIMIAALAAGTVLGASPALRKRMSRRKRHFYDENLR